MRALVYLQENRCKSRKLTKSVSDVAKRLNYTVAGAAALLARMEQRELVRSHVVKISGGFHHGQNERRYSPRVFSNSKIMKKLKKKWLERILNGLVVPLKDKLPIDHLPPDQRRDIEAILEA